MPTYPPKRILAPAVIALVVTAILFFVLPNPTSPEQREEFRKQWLREEKAKEDCLKQCGQFLNIGIDKYVCKIPNNVTCKELE